MRQFTFVGLAVSFAIITAPHPAKAQAFESKEWCRGSSIRCYWDTWDQCRQSTEHMEGGSCYRNPAFAGHPSADPGFRPVPDLSRPSPLPYAAVPIQGRPSRVAARKKHRDTAVR
jgi:hypothetical protein